MKSNTGGADRVIRALLGVVLGVVAFVAGLTGAAQIAVLVVAGILLLTGAVGFCPLYTLLHLNTCRTAAG